MADQNCSPNVTLSTTKSPKERKEILLAILARTQAIREINAETLQELVEINKTSDEICTETSIEEKAVCQDEVIVDSQLMTANSRLIKISTTTLTKTMSPYNGQTFGRKLLRHVHMLPDMTLDHPNWAILNESISKLFKKTANYTTLIGCLEPLEKKVVIKRQPVRREAQAPTTRPQAVATVDSNSDGVEETVLNIKKLIFTQYNNTGQPLDYHRLVLHPQDFGKSVENMIHVSFLVRDGDIKLQYREHRLLVIPYLKGDARSKKKEKEKKPNVQNVVVLTYEQWKMLVEAYQIQRPMINFVQT